MPASARPHPGTGGSPSLSRCRYSLQPVVGGTFATCKWVTRELKTRGTHERLEAGWCLPPQEARGRDTVPGAASGGNAQGGSSAKLAQGHSSLRSPSWGLQGPWVPGTVEEHWGSWTQLSSHKRPHLKVGGWGLGVAPGATQA